MNRVRSYAGRGSLAASAARSFSRVGHIHRAGRIAPLALSFAIILCTLLAIATQSAAQHSGTTGSAPPPPAGNGSLTVRVLHPANPAQAAGITVALYALAPDGRPGLANGETNADGVYTFAGISTDPDIVYLVGANFQQIPFGQRMTFAVGETEA